MSSKPNSLHGVCKQRRKDIIVCKFVDPVMLNDYTLVVWCETHEEFVTVYPDHYVAEVVA